MKMFTVWLFSTITDRQTTSTDILGLNTSTLNRNVANNVNRGLVQSVYQNHKVLRLTTGSSLLAKWYISSPILTISSLLLAPC